MHGSARKATTSGSFLLSRMRRIIPQLRRRQSISSVGRTSFAAACLRRTRRDPVRALRPFECGTHAQRVLEHGTDVAAAIANPDTDTNAAAGRLLSCGSLQRG